jgi:hypothetical protein
MTVHPELSETSLTVFFPLLWPLLWNVTRHLLGGIGAERLSGLGRVSLSTLHQVEGKALQYLKLGKTFGILAPRDLMTTGLAPKHYD